MIRQKGDDVKLEKLFNLHKKPAKETNKKMPHVQVVEKNYVQQADILYLPDDRGYKYALVVADCCTHNMDAEPLKSKSSDDVLKAFEANL